MDGSYPLKATVRAALRAKASPRDERAAKGSIVEAVEPQVVEL